MILNGPYKPVSLFTKVNTHAYVYVHPHVQYVRTYVHTFTHMNILTNDYYCYAFWEEVQFEMYDEIDCENADT